MQVPQELYKRFSTGFYRDSKTLNPKPYFEGAIFEGAWFLAMQWAQVVNGLKSS